jgi:hypothetical protein
MADRLLVYSSFRPDQYQETVAAFKRMIGEFGEVRTDQGLTRAIDESPEFTPSPARIRAMIPRQTAQRQTCPKCVEMQGFVQVDKYSVRLCDHGN